MIKKQIQDRELIEHITSLKDDSREVFLLNDEKIRLSAVNATRLVNEMRASHETGPLETYVLGQAYIAGALLSSEVKGNDRIALQVECGGPIKGLSVESWACGAIRGYLVNNPIPLNKPLTTLDTTFLYGPGFLTITKFLEKSKTPFSGQIMLESGELAKDLALYYKLSEQTPTLFLLSLDFDKKGRVWGAGGLFIQALPGCSQEILDSLDEKCKTLPSISKSIAGGVSVKEYVEREFDGLGTKHLDHSPIGFSCPCSKEGFSKYLSSLPKKEKDEILKGEFPLILKCFNCGTDYSFGKEETETLFGD